MSISTQAYFHALRQASRLGDTLDDLQALKAKLRLTKTNLNDVYVGKEMIHITEFINVVDRKIDLLSRQIDALETDIKQSAKISTL